MDEWKPILYLFLLFITLLFIPPHPVLPLLSRYERKHEHAIPSCEWGEMESHSFNFCFPNSESVKNFLKYPLGISTFSEVCLLKLLVHFLIVRFSF